MTARPRSSPLTSARPVALGRWPFAVGAAVTAVQQQKDLAGLAPFNLLVDELGSDTRGRQPVKLSGRSGKVQMPRTVPDSVEGQVKHEQILGQPLSKEAFDLLSQQVSGRVDAHLSSEIADRRIAQDSREIVRIPWRRPQLA